MSNLAFAGVHKTKNYMSLSEDPQVASSCAFAALIANGTVVTWGDPFNGGDVPQIAMALYIRL